MGWFERTNLSSADFCLHKTDCCEMLLFFHRLRLLAEAVCISVSEMPPKGIQEGYGLWHRFMIKRGPMRDCFSSVGVKEHNQSAMKTEWRWRCKGNNGWDCWKSAEVDICSDGFNVKPDAKRHWGRSEVSARKLKFLFSKWMLIWKFSVGSLTEIEVEVPKLEELGF